MAARFKEYNIPSLVIARMDISEESPPPELNLIPSQAVLPLVIFLPADHKRPPWNYYTGVGKMQSMMKWIEKFASIPFELPNLPHLSEKEREMYKEQVREREEYLEKKRNDEEEAMLEEDRARERYQKQKADAVLESILQDDEEETTTTTPRSEEEETNEF
jgi:hypothetical protein